MPQVGPAGAAVNRWRVRRVLLADASKLGQGRRMQVCDCAEIDVLVTDSEADPIELERMTRAGVARVMV